MLSSFAADVAMRLGSGCRCAGCDSLRSASLPCTGRVGSAFAAELGTMAVTEQTDSLRMLGSDPVDYLVSPRVIACMIALPILNLMCFVMGGSAWPWKHCCVQGCACLRAVPCCLLTWSFPAVQQLNVRCSC